MKLNICGRKYLLRRGDIGENLGLCDPAVGVITIAEDLEDRSNIPADSIELHEVVHAILFETGLTSLFPENIEEAVVSGVAAQLYAVGYRRT